MQSNIPYLSLKTAQLIHSLLLFLHAVLGFFPSPRDLSESPDRAPPLPPHQWLTKAVASQTDEEKKVKTFGFSVFKNRVSVVILGLLANWRWTNLMTCGGQFMACLGAATFFLAPTIISK